MISASELAEKVNYTGDGDFGCAFCGYPGHIEDGNAWCEGSCDSEDVTAFVERWATLPPKCPDAEAIGHARSQCLHCRRRESAVADEDRILRAEQMDPDGEGWAPESLTEVEPVAPPTVLEIADGDYMFRSGWKHLVHGAFQSGKTPLTYLAVVEQVKAGNLAMIVDYEMGPPGAKALLRELGLSDEQIKKQVYYRYQPPAITAKGRRRVIKEVTRLMDATEGELTVAVIDSLTESMATVPGSSDNDALDVAAWGQSLPDWLAKDFGAAVLIIDPLQPCRRRPTFGQSQEARDGAVPRVGEGSSNLLSGEPRGRCLLDGGDEGPLGGADDPEGRCDAADSAGWLLLRDRT